MAGITSNGSAFGNAAAPDGSQMAFLQQTGSASESVYLDAGSYSVSFQAAQRSGQTQTIEVLIDGKAVGTATPATADSASTKPRHLPWRPGPTPWNCWA